jgi:prepilin-type N-terminal cleavage/methylation domain-containing protein
MKKLSKGFTLIELLMVMFLASFVFAGILQIFNLNQSTSLLQKEMLEVHNTGFFAVNLISNDLKKAGSSDASLSKFDINTFNFTETNVDVNGNMKISLVYDNFDSDFNCAGVSGLATITNKYEVVDKVLYCNDIELVTGVERFSVLFGVDLNGDNFTDRYVDRDSALEIQDSNNKKIVSVYFSLLLKSTKELESDSVKSFNILNQETLNFEDGYFYRLFSKKIVLKNML